MNSHNLNPACMRTVICLHWWKGKISIIWDQPWANKRIRSHRWRQEIPHRSPRIQRKSKCKKVQRTRMITMRWLKHLVAPSFANPRISWKNPPEKKITKSERQPSMSQHLIMIPWPMNSLSSKIQIGKRKSIAIVTWKKNKMNPCQDLQNNQRDRRNSIESWRWLKKATTSAADKARVT